MARHEDMFGNLKIPNWEALNGSLTDDGWKNVPQVLSPEDFSSLLGLRVDGLPDKKDLRFNLESSYITTECSPFFQLPYSLNVTRADVERLSRLFSFNFTTMYEAGLMPGKSRGNPELERIRTWFLDTDRRQNLYRLKAYLGWATTKADQKVVGQRRRLVYGSIKAVENGRRHLINLSNCSLLELRVESAVYCPSRDAEWSGSCRVERMRLSRTDTRPQTITAFEIPELASKFCGDMMLGSNPGLANVASGDENFLRWGRNSNRLLHWPELNITTNTPVVDMAQVAPRVFSRRLGIFINTNYQRHISSTEDAPFSDPTLFYNISLPATDIAMFGTAPTSPPLLPPGRANATGADDLERLYTSLPATDHALFVYVPTSTPPPPPGRANATGADDFERRSTSVPATNIALSITAPTSAPLPPPGRANATGADEFERRYNATRESVSNAMSAGLAFVPAAATATATTRTRVFVCNFAWLGALLLASAALFVAGAASLALQLHSTLAPDMLRYVASMTYTNRHFRTPAGGSALDGMARARLLRDVPVHIGIVASGDRSDVGEVAFVATTDVEVIPLKNRRRPAGNV